MKKTPFTRPKGAIYAVNIDSTLDEHAEAFKKAAPADDWLLDMLIDRYEEALRSPYLRGPGHAEALFWEEVKKYAVELTQGELDILNKAKGGDLRAVQILVKANGRILRLPFAQTAIIELLRQQKYNTSKEGAALKDKWGDFLHKRAKGKILYDNTSFEALVNEGTKRGGKRSAVLTKVATLMGVSTDYVKDATEAKGVKGRRKG